MPDESALPSEPNPPHLSEVQDSFAVPPELFARTGRVISVINQKGGCGKTTTAINLSGGLAQEGFQVLLIDLDPQANATMGLGVRVSPEEKTIYDLFKNQSIDPADLVRPTQVQNLFVLPASKALASLTADLQGMANWEYAVRSFLRPLRPSYHYLFIDCPPTLTTLTVNALTASEDMIIPIQTHYFSLEGMKELFFTVESIQAKLNPALGGGSILPTLFDKRTKINREMLQAIRDYFGERVFETVIHNNIRLVEAVMHGEPISVYDPLSRGAEDYRALCRELLLREAVVIGHCERSPSTGSALRLRSGW